MRITSVFITGLMLLSGGILGPTACRSPKLSQVSAQSVRIRSVIKKTSGRRGGIYIGGGSSRSGSSRYSSGGGFSSGK